MSQIPPGSTLHTVLVYTISEPGAWTVADIAEDLGIPANELDNAAATLFEAGYIHINSYDTRLWPLREGKNALRAAG